jgi:glycosyltransferase involved in cell wall biosynthesis
MENERLKILLLAEDKSANTMAWVKAFQECQCKVSVVSARAPLDHDNVFALKLFFLPPRLKFLFCASQLRNIISREKPDIVIGYRITSYGYLAINGGFSPIVIAAQNENIVTAHKFLFFLKPFLSYCARRAISKADLIHAWGSNMKDGILKFGGSLDKIIIMHRGIDFKTFFPRERDFVVTDQPVIISTRSLYPEYNIDILIRTFSFVLRKYPKAILKIIGDGPDRSRLEKLAEDIEVRRNVLFYKSLDPEFTANQLRGSDIYISLIQTEGVSSSLLEACACGVFPIVCDMPASRDIIEDKKNGMLINSEDPFIISKSIMESYENRQFRKNAYNINKAIVLERFDSRKNTDFFLSSYMNLIKKNQNGDRDTCAA